MATITETEGDIERKVRIQDDKLIIEKLVIDDPEIVGYVRTIAHDMEKTIVEALRLGMRSLRIAQTVGDVEMVKREFESMISGIGTNVDKVLMEAKEALGKRLSEFTSEELQRSLRDHRGEIQTELVRLFGPESAVSVQKQVDKMLEAQGKSYAHALTQVLADTDNPENPFFKLRKELKDKADEAVKEVRLLRDKVLETVSEAKGAALEREKGTAKGRTYQEYVFERVEGIARVFGDTAEYVADQLGEKGKSRAGDVLITLNPKDTGNADIRSVIEAKNRGTTVPAILNELDEAMENRLAVSAIAVFSKTEYVPPGLRSWRDYPGCKYICVLTEDESDPFALEFSYRCARVDALRSVEIPEQTIDFVAVQNMLKQVRARLNEFAQMRTKLTGAQAAIGDVQNLIDNHQKAMRNDLDEIDRLLSKPQQRNAST
jgi:hypothetical protein